VLVQALVYLILRSLSSVFSKDSKLGGDVAAETREKGMWLDRTEVASVDNDEACELVSGADLVNGVDVDDEGEDMSAPHLPAAASRHHRQRQRLDGGVVESILVMMAIAARHHRRPHEWDGDASELAPP
uniref:Uncharacterized protein n=1 Tax=Oryza glaberrima TaxID=4538 RepID=I1R7I7_ORYGL